MDLCRGGSAAILSFLFLDSEVLSEARGRNRIPVPSLNGMQFLVLDFSPLN